MNAQHNPMNVQRFLASSAREALAKARMAFGDATLILSNRQTPNGVEVVATTEDMLETFTQDNTSTSNMNDTSGGRNSKPDLKTRASFAAPSFMGSAATAKTAASNLGRTSAPAQRLADTPVQEDVESMAMSTLSFQDYVRERMLRRRHEALHGTSNQNSTEPQAATFSASSATRAAPQPHNQGIERATFPRINTAPSLSEALRPAPRATREPIAVQPAVEANSSITRELQSMRDMIEERFSTMSWLGQAKQDPIQSNLMLKLIRSGYSPAIARVMLERMPADLGAGGSMRWIMDVLERNLKTDAGDKPLYALGGTYALVGATGVGKTTTAAKLAALCAKTHGAHSVGLITLDTYRVAAHEQLRAYGRMLGVVAHLAHDRAALQDLLSLLGNKKLVLIDTTGLAPKDPRTQDMLEMLNLPKVERLLVLNAGGHGDTQDDVLTAFKAQGAGGVILSKLDEAAKLGPSLDALIRHQLTLRGVTQGQRVPEDWDAADAASLIRLSMRTSGKSAYDPVASDLSFFFTPANQAASLEGQRHA